MTESSMADFYDEALRVPERVIGFGPGTRPIRPERRGDSLLVSDGPGAPQLVAGTVPSGRESLVADGEVVYVSFDHKLRYLRVPELEVEKRVYSGTITVWEKDLETVRALYDDVVQP